MIVHMIYFKSSFGEGNGHGELAFAINRGTVNRGFHVCGLPFICGETNNRGSRGSVDNHENNH